MVYIVEDGCKGAPKPHMPQFPACECPRHRNCATRLEYHSVVSIGTTRGFDGLQLLVEV